MHSNADATDVACRPGRDDELREDYHATKVDRLNEEGCRLLPC